ncbi:hypothetical protein AB0H86_15195 [Streptomyces sp. NPDC050997]
MDDRRVGRGLFAVQDFLPFDAVRDAVLDPRETWEDAFPEFAAGATP